MIFVYTLLKFEILVDVKPNLSIFLKNKYYFYLPYMVIIFLRYFEFYLIVFCSYLD